MEILKLILKGIVLGVANVIPGVSGGTMAVVFNVYDKIIELICPNVKKILKAWKFWLPLGIGMGIGVIGFSKIITKLLENFPIPTTFFFIGLILGSIPLIFRKMKSNLDSKIEAKKIVFIVLSFLIGLFLVLSMIIFGSSDIDSAKNAAKTSAMALSTSLDIKTAILLFIAGVAAAVAMIIPGISGSFLLLALGMYGTIMASISHLDVIFLLPFAFGVVVGLILGAGLVRFLMAKIPAYTYSAILGLIVGSVFVIFPGFCTGLTMIISVATAIIGFFCAFISSKNE